MDITVGGALNGLSTEVSIPYEDGELPGYLMLVDDSGTPRPTVIYTGGIDSTREEGYFVVGAAALRMGYNFLAYDGPGQGAMIDQRAVTSRPDWENVLGPVVDFALTVPDIDAGKIVQFGHGLGGYLVARYASRDHRSAAIVCNDAITTFYAAWPAIPEPILELIEDGRDDEAILLLDGLVKDDTRARTELQDGQRAFGADTSPEYVRRTADYSLTTADVRRIQTPVLLLEGEADNVFAGQAANFAFAMTAPVHYVVTRRGEDDVHHVVFSHLAETLR